MIRTTMQSNLRIHVVPVGFYFRRVTVPLIRMRADKAYLVKHTRNDSEVANMFYAKIEKELENNYKHIQREDVFVDLWNLYECMEKFREIIYDARENHVYFNVSTGSKITSIAGMLACMLWNAHPYYVPIKYTENWKSVDIDEEVCDPEDLPTYSINKPRAEFMLILDLIDKHGGTMGKTRLIKKLEEEGVIKPLDSSEDELSSPAKHNRLRSLLNPMERDWKLVSVRTQGRRSEVSIQDQGKSALRIFGTEY